MSERPRAELSLHVAGTRTALEAMRRALNEFLTDHGVSEGERRDAVLVAHELAANAIEHGNRGEGEIELEVWLDRDAVAIGVRDAGKAERQPFVKPASAERESGRGLMLVEWLSDWEERQHNGRREIVARLKTAERREPADSAAGNAKPRTGTR